MKRILLRGATIVAAAIVQLGAMQTPTGEALIANARHKASVDGDVRAAIELYKQAVSAAGRNRALAAEALVAMAECYQKLGDAEARKVYEEVLRKYADQTSAANVARERLGRSAVPVAGRGDRAVWTGTDVDLFGTVSPDGRFLTYIDWTLGNVMLRDLAAQTSRPLTSNGKGYEHGSPHFSAISRDGEYVAFGWYQSTGSATRFELRVAPLDEPSIRRTRTIWSADGAEIRPFEWSHDGKRIAVLVERADRTSQLGLLGIDGSLQNLTSLGWRGTSRAAFSPDSRYLVYAAARAAETRHEQIRIIATDASRETVAFEDPSANTVMGWSADGRHVLFASDRSGVLALWALPVRDGRPDGPAFVVRSELASTWSLGLTPSGTMYVWKSSGALYVASVALDLDTGRLATKPAFQRFIESRGRPTWSADGKALLYISCGPIGGGPCSMHIWSSDTGSVREIPHSLGYVRVPRLSPDLRTILTNGQDFKGRRGVYLVDAASGETRFVLADGQALDWSVDGQAFYYIARRSGRQWIIERQVQSEVERDVVVVPAGCQNSVRLSPDRRMVGCTSRVDPDRTSTFLVAPMDGGTARAVLRVPAGEALSNFWSWMPDGRGAILIRTNARATDALWHVPLEGTPRRLDVDLSKWTGDGDFQLHADGRHLAFSANAGEPGAQIWALENVLPRPGRSGRK
jgi:Tol biopolymer transport system component